MKEIKHVKEFEKIAKEKFDWEAGALKPAEEIVMDLLNPWVEEEISIPSMFILFSLTKGFPAI